MPYLAEQGYNVHAVSLRGHGERDASPVDRTASLADYAADLQTKKGNYRIVVNVRDLATGKMGTARANVRVE